MKPKVLITAKEVHELIPQQLKELGYDVVHLPEPTEEALLQVVQDYEGLIITTYTKVNQRVLDKALQLRFVGRVGSGLENVDVAAAKDKGIQVFSSPEGNANAVGEHALTLLLNLMNKVSVAHQEVQQGVWKREENRGEELDGKVVGIIGLGNTGSAFAKKLRGFDVEILAYDKFKTNYATDTIKESSMQEIAEKADIISFHIPYSKDNHHIINDVFISKLKKQIYLIQTSRGALMDTEAVLSHLKTGEIKALGIDVYEDEPWTKGEHASVNVYQALLSLAQVIATPHIAGWTQESKIKLANVLMEKIKTFVLSQK